jgi:hypothetical protein
VTATLALSVSLSVLAPAAPGDAPMTLITDHGVELSANEQVFLLFAALNAAGYAEEPRREGPPLNAPVFHPLREEVRDALREVKSRPSLEAVRSVFKKNPQPIPVYLEAVLSMAPGAPDATGPAAKLEKRLAPLADFRSDASLEALIDRLADEQRAHMKELKGALEQDFEAVRDVLGDEAFRAPVRLVVVPNPLDGHGLVRKLSMGGETYLVVGPGLDQARMAILEAALEPAVREMVSEAYGRARSLARSWSTLKTSKRITRSWPTGQAYLTDALTHALAHRALEGAPKGRRRDVDEAFIDAQAKDGMRWARAALRIVDRRGDAPLAEALPRLVAKAKP